jgi:thymidine phosphorylase
MEFAGITDIVRRIGKDHVSLAAFLRSSANSPLNVRDAAELTRAILDSGDVWHFPPEITPITTVHSTGAPGSLTTILSPVLAASVGFYVPVFSVKGGVAGAIDSLSSIAGFESELSESRFKDVLAETHLAHVGHGAPNLAPADKVLWGLREETGTKKLPALIAASLVSKQLASGAKYGSVDIRVGPSGNAGDDIDEALKVGCMIIDVAREMGARVNCVFSDCRLPPWKRLGRVDTVLSLLDVLESPEDYRDHPHMALCHRVAAAACHASDPTQSLEKWLQGTKKELESREARKLFRRSLLSHGSQGEALAKVRAIAAQRVPVTIATRGQVINGRKLSGVFRDLRNLVPSENRDALGLHVAEDFEHVTVLLPPGADEFSDDARRIVTRSLICASEDSFFEGRVLLYDGTLVR